MIAAQLYTLREFTKTPADIAKTLARVKQMGYNGVQCSALGPIDPSDLAKILRDNALACVATHVPLDRREKEQQKIIDEYAMWGCVYTAVGGCLPKESCAGEVTAPTWVDFASRAAVVAAR